MYVADYTDDACLGEIDLEYNKYIAEGRLIRICPKQLEAKDLKDNLMRNHRLFVFIIGLEILLQNMANNVIDSKGRIPHNSKDEDKMQFKKYCKVIKLHQKRIFLERWVKKMFYCVQIKSKV